MEDIIFTSHLTKHFGATIAVDDVSLSIKKGEVFGFLGLNGAGKTTVIRMLLGMVKPTSGVCRLRGEKVNAGRTDLWEDVGYMVETPYSYPELTVRENLEIICRLRGIEGKKHIDFVIDKLNLKAYADKKAGHLSLGNSQRLGIAKAIIHNPEILILDEPTNGLDPAGIVEVRELLRDLAHNAGVTVFVSSHKLDEISKTATIIGIIHQGRLLKEINSTHLERQLKKSLLIDGRDRAGITSALSKAGFNVKVSDELPLRIENEDDPGCAEKVVTMLVNAGCPPTLLKIEKEDLESYFLRTIKEAGGISQ